MRRIINLYLLSFCILIFSNYSNALEGLNSKLIEATKAVNLNEVKFLLEQGANVNARDEDDLPVLMWAIARKSLPIVSILIEKGADVNIKVTKGYLKGATPLMIAVNVGSTELIKLLLNKGAEVNAKTEDNVTPLLLSVGFNANNIEIVKLLLSKGADINIRDKDGISALYTAVDYGYKEIVMLLIENGADVNVRAKNKSIKKLTPLMTAKTNGFSEIEKLLRKAGAKEIQESEIVHSNLIEAATACHLNNVKGFLIKGENIDTKNEKGQTALIVSVGIDCTEVVKFLLEKGADVNSIDRYGNTALINAVYYGKKIEIMELLLSHGSNVNCKNNDGETPLYIATMFGSTEKVKILLENGADVNFRIVSGKLKDKSLLALAKRNGDARIVKLLKKYGAKE